MSEIFYTYILYSKTDNKFYIGYTNDLKERLQKHKAGTVHTTSRLRDWKLVYYEVCLSKKDAMERERQLKTGYGRQYLRKRLNNYLKGV